MSKTMLRTILGLMFSAGLLSAAACSDDTGAGGTTSGGGGSGGTPANGGTNTTGADDADKDGFTEVTGDCDDNDASVNPNAEENCSDGKDNDCDGSFDGSESDEDGDGFGPCGGDCDEDNPLINPAAVETPGDGIDNNCDGTVDADFDADGFTEEEGDCNDDNASVNPDAKEVCHDIADNDCDGFADALEPDDDMDGFGPCAGDCDDTDATVNPNAVEIDGDGIDNDCDNLIDYDIDGDGWTEPNGDCDENNPAVNPAAIEDCDDGIDNDCNGVIDTDCLTPCELAELLRSSVGCVYYAVDANNDPVEGYDSLPYAVGISNVDPMLTAVVQIQTRSGGVWSSFQTVNVAPGTLMQITLPDRHVNYTNVNPNGAYRIVSDVPVIAYQFQPISGESSFTSDASLLLPVSSLDQFYYVAGWGEPSFGNAQLVVVATQDNTSVTVRPTQTTLAGGGIPAIAANTPYTRTLNDGDYIQIEADTASLTGSYITSDKPVSVFSANWCANIPTQVCCCDHLEEQLYGVQTWGQTYVASRLPVRSTGTPDPTYWHIVASENGTVVTFRSSPGVTGLPAGPQTLNAGQFLTLGVSGTVQNPGDFIVNGTRPILVMEYMTSSATTNAPAAVAGDPAMTLSVPAEQYLDHYVVLVPANWVQDRMVLTKPVGSTITLDGTAVAQNLFIPINDGVNPVEWEVARISVTDGVHTLDGTEPFGVLVLGFDQYDSYAYPGGLDQQLINPLN